jgi:NAD-dependent dihydropyrimidine dehydrogenase PreA subunit
MKVACPALSFKDGTAEVFDRANCTACGLCAQMCKFDAISVEGA